MTRVRAFFLEEATECLRIAREEMSREIPDRWVVYRSIRRLRGSAQLARYGEVARRAAALESRTRPGDGGEEWSAELAAAMAAELTVLDEAVETVRRGEVEPGEETDRNMEADANAGGVVGIEELEYRGSAALERALELRPALEDTIIAEAPVGPLLDELFDLIRMGMG